MSIFSKIFLAISTFITNLWNSTKSEWNKLAPEVQADFTKVITWGNLIKGYIQNPASVPDGIGGLITIIEAAIGPVYMGIINTVLNDVLIGAGIIETALTDPVDAYTAFIAYLKGFGANTLGDIIGVFVSKIVDTIVNDASTLLNNNQVKAIIAFVYDTFFKAAPVVTTAAPVVPAQAPANVPQSAS